MPSTPNPTRNSRPSSTSSAASSERFPGRVRPIPVSNTSTPLGSTPRSHIWDNHNNQRFNDLNDSIGTFPTLARAQRIRHLHSSQHGIPSTVDPARQTRQASTRAMVESNASGRRRSNSNFRDDLNQLSTSLRRASIRTRTNSTRTSSIPLEARDTAPPEVQPHSNALQPLNRNSRMLTAQLANPEFRINFPSVTTSNPSHASRSRDHHPLRQASDIPLCIRLQMDFIESQLSTLEGELEITNSFPEAEAEDQGEEAEDEGYQSIDA